MCLGGRDWLGLFPVAPDCSYRVYVVFVVFQRNQTILVSVYTFVGGGSLGSHVCGSLLLGGIAQKEVRYV